ncbi:MAG: hypothetical protein M9918_03320 [Anaerolineae bacterium]|nr:hypothetical protein [Anaerolineae bacterium]
MKLRTTIILTCLVLLMLSACGSFTPTPDPRFGVIESYEAPSAADKLGIGWTRVRFHWGDEQPDPTQSWQPTVDDKLIDAEIDAGREVVGLIIGIPDWARDEKRIPQGLWLPHNDPNNLFAEWARTVFRRYNGRINHWVIWNEPDIWDLETPGHTWEGDEADFAQLMRVAYTVAKEENPDSVLHLAAMTYFWDANFGRTQYLDRLLTELEKDPQAAENNYYFDVATAHLYFQPEQIYDIITEWQAIMTAHGLERDWWLMETNAPPHDDPAWPASAVTLSVMQPEQAAYIPQAMALALAADVDRIGVFKLKDIDSDRDANPEPFGLLREDGSRRPAFDTYRIAVDRMAATTSAERERWDEIGQIRLDQGGKTTTILFTRLPIPQQATVAATGNSAELVTMYGESEHIQPKNNVYTIDLPPALCSQSIGDYCMIGSSVFYLIQENEPD